MEDEKVSNNEEDNDIGTVEIMLGFTEIISGGVFAGFCGWAFINAADSITRKVMFIFLIAGLVLLTKGIVTFVKGLKLKKGLKDGSISAKEVFNTDDKLNILSKILYGILFIVMIWMFYNMVNLQ